MSDDIVAQLQGASPRRLLEDLARIAGVLAKNNRARPEVELLLSSGQTVRGRIVSIADDRQGAIAVVHVGGTAREPTVSFVRVDQIASLTVADASLLVKAPVSDSPVPSKLALQRELAARGDGLASKLGRALKLELAGDLDDDGRRAVGTLVPILFEVLTSIAGDDMGKEALASVEHVELGAAGSGEVRKEQRGFLVLAPKLLTEQFTHATLRGAIEKHL